MAKNRTRTNSRIQEYWMILTSVGIFLKCWYLRNIRKKEFVLESIDGRNMYLDLSDPGISRQLMLNDIREPILTEIIKQELDPGMAVVEIGANIGYYTLIIAETVGSLGQVYAFEPVEENANILRQNVEGNGFENVEIITKAVGEANANSTIYITNDSNLATTFDVESDKDLDDEFKREMKLRKRKVKNIQTVSLDSWSKEMNNPEIDLIRMDIQGGEIQAIKGMTGVLANVSLPTTLIIEFHNDYFDSIPDTIGNSINIIMDTGFRPDTIILDDKIEVNDKENFINIINNCNNRNPAVIFRKAL